MPPSRSSVGHGLPGNSALVGTIATSVLIQGFSLISGVLVARMLGPSDRGVLAAAIFWPVLAAGIGLLGTNSALALRAANRQTSFATLQRLAAGLAILLASVAAVSCWLLLPFLLKGHQEALALGRFYVLFIPLFVAVALLQGLDQGIGRFRRFNITRVVLNPVYLGAVLALWLAGIRDVRWVLAALFLANLVTAAARLALSGRPATRPLFDRAELATLLRQGRPFWITDTLSLVYQRVDQVLVIWLLDSRALGLYVVSMAAASLHMNIPKALGLITFARAASLPRHLASDDAARNFRYMAIVGLLVAVPLLVSLPWLLPTVYGLAFRDAVAPALVLVVAHYFMSQGDIINEALRGQQRPYPGLRARGLATLLFFGLGALIVPSFGIVGIAAAALVSHASYLAYLLLALRRVHPRARFLPRALDCAEVSSHLRRALRRS